MCGCGATPGNTEAMMKDMMGKLANAQEEINQLQEELAKLQRMDASKRTGPHAGPNPAALYREIMKDTSVRKFWFLYFQQRLGNSVLQGMNRGPYEPGKFSRLQRLTCLLNQFTLVCVPCGDDSARTSSGSYMGTPGCSPNYQFYINYLLLIIL